VATVRAIREEDLFAPSRFAWSGHWTLVAFLRVNSSTTICGPKPLFAYEESAEKRITEREAAMGDRPISVSPAFQAFMTEAPAQARAWSAVVQALDEASALDKKTEELAYLAVLAALRMESGVPFHVQMAKQAGATRNEVISAILVGLPAAGLGVTQVLPAALGAYDGQ